MLSLRKVLSSRQEEEGAKSCCSQINPQTSLFMPPNTLLVLGAGDIVSTGPVCLPMKLTTAIADKIKHNRRKISFPHCIKRAVPIPISQGTVVMLVIEYAFFIDKSSF